MKLRPLAAALACAHALILASLDAHASHADEGLEEIIVTAVHMRKPLQVTTDPALPRQPLPAHDGADYLKTIPGFNVIRKGGTDGDPMFRGMALEGALIFARVEDDAAPIIAATENVAAIMERETAA